MARKKIKKDYWHYKRTCKSCGYVWGGLHCIHDMFQNCCPECGIEPKPVKGDCNCKFNF